ncbi:NAD(P)H-dependent oxidoreductase [Candidatus Micrarchaeota archaeon]|nr:NAD(P)H-dependent oxidoreductase [Candidatus Micrarchaeota archaeon]
MEFKQIISNRYATKSFDGRPLLQDQVDALLELIRFAPSSFNLQPWKILVIKDAATKEKLAPAAWNQAQITTCSHLLVLLADTNVSALIDRLDAQMTAAGVHADQRDPYLKMMRGFASGMSDDQKRSWSQRQVYLALGNALNGAKSLGFDSCPMEGFDPVQFAKILNLPANLVPTVLCPIGYAADVQPAKIRFDKKDVVIVP